MASCAEIKGLMQAYVDGELSAAEKAILEQHAAHCRACSVRLERRRSASAILFEALGEQRLRHDLTPAVMAHLPDMEYSAREAHAVTWRTKHPRPRMTALFTLLPALAPVLLIVLGLAIAYSWPPEESSRPEIGMVTFQNGDALRSDVSSTQRSRVRLSSLVREKERFETREDAKLMIGLAGPSLVKVDTESRIRIDDARNVNVEKGRVWLSVGKDDSSFRVTTPAGEITVFGTVFSVEVSANHTLVTVAEGRVQVDNGEGFAIVEPGEQVEVRTGRKLVAQAVNVVNETAWAAEIMPNRKAMKAFDEQIRPSAAMMVRAMQVFLVETLGRRVESITFEWRPDGASRGHCGYLIYIYDEHLNKSLYRGEIHPQIFADKNRDSFELMIPEDAGTENVKSLHIRVVPDRRMGEIETPFDMVFGRRM